MSGAPELQVAVSARRRAAGWSSSALAEAVGISRQALHAIETGRAAPSTPVALRLARVLGCRVEDLFALPGGLGALAPPAPPGARLALGRIGGRWVARALDPRGAEPADGLVADRGGIEALADPERLGRAVWVSGCAPVLGLLAGHLAARGDGGARWLPGTSGEALAALAEDRTHLAGLHLAAADDPGAHERLVRARLPGEACDLVGLVGWREGLALAPGNPRGVRSVEDLVGLRVARRPAGAGAEQVLADALARVGLDPGACAGPRVTSHVDAAAVVLHGAADAAVLVEPVAEAFGLAFLPLSEERFELALRARDREHPGVRRRLEQLSDARFAREVRALGAYDTARMGALRRVEAA